MPNTKPNHEVRWVICRRLLKRHLEGKRGDFEPLKGDLGVLKDNTLVVSIVEHRHRDNRGPNL